MENKLCNQALAVTSFLTTRGQNLLHVVFEICCKLCLTGFCLSKRKFSSVPLECKLKKREGFAEY